MAGSSWPSLPDWSIVLSRTTRLPPLTTMVGSSVEVVAVTFSSSTVPELTTNAGENPPKKMGYPTFPCRCTEPDVTTSYSVAKPLSGPFRVTATPLGAVTWIGSVLWSKRPPKLW